MIKNRRQYKFSRLNDVAHRAMDWIGSVQSLMVHTMLFAGSFALVFFGFNFEKILLVVTTLVSLEAIYMAIFIQMAVNQNTQSLGDVEEDIEEIQEDVEEIQEDVEEIEKGVDEIERDIDEIQKDVDDIEADTDASHAAGNQGTLQRMEERLQKIAEQIGRMKNESEKAE